MRGSLSRGALAAALAVLAGGAGCDWRDFDQIKEHTPVLSIGPPSKFDTADDFGRYVLPLSGPAEGATGGRFLVSAATTARIGIMAIDAAGHASGVTSSPAVFGSGPEALPITSMAQIPGGNQILLGAPQANTSGSAYVLTLGTNVEATLLESPAGEDRFGLGVAAGMLAGGPAPDLVVVSSSQLHLYVDGDVSRAVVTGTSAECPLDIDEGSTLPGRDRQNRAVLVGAFTGGAGQQILVGTPSANGDGHLAVFDVDPTTGAVSCAFSLFQAGVRRFGHAVATGHFDDGPVLDLVVGAPPNGAFWISGPLAHDSPIRAVTLAPAQASAELGFAVAAIRRPGQPVDDVLVGDEDAVVDGKAAAGQVRVAADAGLAKESTALRRQTPGENEAFGVAVGALPFCASACGTPAAVTTFVPLVGSKRHVLAFFKGADLFDPRTP